MSVTVYQVDSSVAGVPGRSVRVYFPPDYEHRPADRFPVLYMHDGQNVFSPGGDFGCWFAEITADREIVAGRIPPLIIAAIDNDGANRGVEYVPPGDRYKDFPTGKASSYARYVAEDVIPCINAHCRTLTGPRHTAIAGSSLGGVVSLYLAMTTDLFGTAASLSTAICWAPTFMKELAGTKKKPIRIYHDIGTAESAEMAPADYWEKPRELHRLLAALGYRENSEISFVVGRDDGHNEAAWARRFPDVLRWMYGN